MRKIFWSASLLLLGACGDAGNNVTFTNPTSTWERIHTRIIAPSCMSGCHESGSEDAKSSGLVLNGDVAYNNLVSVTPHNVAAKSDGLSLVKGFDTAKSYLLWKLTFQASPAGRDYGAPMPLGRDPLTNGEVEYIRRWILAGAPKTGEVVDTMVLADKTRFDINAFTALAPPASGYQLHINPFSVSPNFEREIFVYNKIGNTSDIFVNRVETKMRSNSHHLLAYTFRETTPSLAIPPLNTVRDIRNADGSMNILNMIPMGYHVFFAGSMTPTSDYTFPAGVALRLAGGSALDLNAHYVNKGTAPVTGEAYINLYTVPQAQVQREAKTLDMNNTDITLPANKVTTVTKTFTVSQTMTIFLLTSHMHARGEKFVVKIKGGARDGEIVYTNTDWEHPLMQSYSTPIVLTAGQGLTSEITYNNNTSRVISFGLTSEDEMGIIFGYYY